MSKKNRRRRGGQQPRQAGSGAPSQTEALTEEERAERRTQQKAEWAAQKRKAERRPIASSPWIWIGSLAGAGVVALVVAFLVFSGGDSESAPVASATPDPRVAGLPIAETIDLEAGGAESGSYFNPQQITGPAGEVIEIVVTNTGTVSHNLRVSGEDGEYGDDRDPGDDFVSDPFAIKPGETVTTLVKIDEPGSYPFRCDFHPLDQVGTLVLS